MLKMGIGLKGCHGARDCLGAEGVLRVSLGCFVSFVATEESALSLSYSSISS